MLKYAVIVVPLLAACAAPRLLSAQTTPAAPVSCTDDRADGEHWTACLILRKDLARVRIYSQRESRQPVGTIAALDSMLHVRGERLALATNGGIFENGEKPLGLLVQDGKTVVPLNLQPGPKVGDENCAVANFYCPPGGVFLLTSSEARIVTREDYRDGDVRSATQSGPLVLIGGKLARGFDANSSFHLLRNGVCVRADGAVGLFLATNVNFYQFATTLRDRYACRDALFLDGTISVLYRSGDPAPGGRFGSFIAVLEASPRP